MFPNFINLLKPSPDKQFIVLVLLGLFVSNSAFAVTRTLGAPGTVITVTSTADRPLVFPGQPYPCTLRDAIAAANTNQAVGGCPAGRNPRWISASPLRIDYIDQIKFDIGMGTPSIKLRSPLPAITEAVDIDGSTGGATRVEINGAGIISLATNPPNGLTITERATSVGSMVINNFAGNGILITEVDEEGRPLPPPEDPQIDDPTVPEHDPNDPCGPNAYPRDPDCPPGEGGDGPDLPPIMGGGGGGHYLANNLIGTDASGTVAIGNGLNRTNQGGIVVLTNANVIGGNGEGEGNVVAGNRGHGIILAGVNNEVIANAIGTNHNMDVGLSNRFDGIRVLGESLSQAACLIRDNVIAYNLGNGVSGIYSACGVISNRTTRNDLLGIDWGTPGVTANDRSGTRLQPPNFPTLSRIRYAFIGGGFETQVSGWISQLTGADIRIELYHNSSCDPSRYGEGDALKGSTVINGGGSFTITIPGYVSSQNLSATASLLDNLGVARNTSEFSQCANLF